MKHTAKKGFFSAAKIYQKVFLIFFMVCILITVFSFQYYGRLSSTIQEESKGYLQEVARRVGTNVDRIVSDNYGVLHTMASSLEYMEVSQLSEARGILQSQRKFWSFDNIFLIDVEGTSYNLSNSEAFLVLDKDVRQDLLSGKEGMSTTQIIKNKEYILFSVPLDDITIEGKEMVALAVSYAPSAFDQVLSMSSFNERAYSKIVTTTGSVVVRSSSPHAFKSGYNVFATLKKANLTEGKTLAQMENDLRTHQSGQINFELEGRTMYMVYTPVLSGNWYLLSFVPVEVVNEKSNLLLQSTMILCGFITLAFAGLAAMLVYIFNNHKRKLEKIAYVDDVTGGHTIKRFYELAEEQITENYNTHYALVYTNIIKFKVLNDEIGRINCDAILRFFSEYINSKLLPQESIGRQSADNFCILVEFSDEAKLLEQFGEWHEEAEALVLEQKMSWSLPIVEFGIYVIEGTALTFPQMIDRAKLALKETPRPVDNKLRCAFYDDAVRRQLLREKQLEDRMGKALTNNEFKVFLQPKYHLPDEIIGGAEALVRWQSEEEGMIYPDEFIPLFEKNGFIIQLDLFVFETVCKTLRRWIDQGKTPVRVSVNCSRLHFKDPNFVLGYTRIADKYKLDRSFIEIEMTESMIIENSDYLIHIIRNIKEEGFWCSMDDFGSGYSSLNLIQTIPVDVIKLDKIFFRDEGVDLLRTEAVVTNVVSLAKALSMETVAEGVEKREQVEMLKIAGCDYIQGYVFARPMDIAAFEELAFKE